MSNGAQTASKTAELVKDKKKETIAVRVLRDFWAEETKDKNGNTVENRCRAGQVLEMPIEAAFDAVEQGMVERVKDVQKV